jgi:hypothetical protein
MTPPPPERRAGRFTERLSMFMCVVAAMGAAAVLLDPKFTFNVAGQTIAIGGDGFSADLKGAVITAILISGWTAVKEFWLGASASGQNQAESMSRIAEAAAPATAAAVAAAVVPAVPASIPAKDVSVTAAGDVTVETKPPGDTK